MPSQPKLDGQIRAEAGSPAMSDLVIPVRGVDYILHEFLGAGETGVTWKGSNDVGEHFAVKLCTPELYSGGSVLEEVIRVRALRDCRNIARLEGWGKVSIELPTSKQSHEFVCLVTEFVDGETLREYLRSTSVTPQDLRAFVRGICEALYSMQYNGLHHNDMHDRNIMITKARRDSLSEESRFVRVIDTGSMRSSNRPITGDLNDHDQLVRHIVSFYNTILLRRSRLTLGDKRYLSEVCKLLVLMLEEDVERRLSDPRRIWEEFDQAWIRASFTGPEQRTLRLITPFDYISAEHVASDRLLEKLFSKKCPWFESVRGPDPVCLDGPRGCGKSTVFRMLRLKTLLAVDKTNFNKIREIGFYLSCSSELRSRFAYLSETMAQKLQTEIIHYFNLQVLKEVLETLRLITIRQDHETTFGWSEVVERDLYTFLLRQLNREGSASKRLNGVSRLDYLTDLTDQDMAGAYRHILQGLNLDWTTSPSFLAEMMDYLQSNIPFFKERRILILLDDYSLHRIPAHIQRILNLVIWDRQSSHVFKLSAEVHGVEKSDVLQGAAEESRELIEVNVGLEYLNLSEQKKAQEFIEDVLNRRFKLAGYRGRARALLGDTRYPNNKPLGAALKAETAGAPVYYHGLACLSELCTGDISTMLDIVRHIFRESSVMKSQTGLITPYTQHKAVQDLSRQLYERISDFVPYGKDMYAIVSAFGYSSRTLLMQHTGVRRGGGRVDPYEMIRVEVDEAPEDLERIGELATILNQLLRRSIFIQLRPGRSRRGGLTWRFQLRRIYCPTFKTTLTHSEPFRLSVEELRFFLSRPRDFCKMYIERRLGKRTLPKVDFYTVPFWHEETED
jgi:tRNA A-37 threonylcarbamoyl transferase component Bud32